MKDKNKLLSWSTSKSKLIIPKYEQQLLRCLMSWPTNGWKDLESKQTNKQTKKTVSCKLQQYSSFTADIMTWHSRKTAGGLNNKKDCSVSLSVVPVKAAMKQHNMGLPFMWNAVITVMSVKYLRCFAATLSDCLYAREFKEMLLKQT